MKKLLILLIAGVLFAVEAYQQQNISVPESLLQASDSKEKISADNRDLKRAYEAKQSNLQVQGSGLRCRGKSFAR